MLRDSFTKSPIYYYQCVCMGVHVRPARLKKKKKKRTHPLPFFFSFSFSFRLRFFGSSRERRSGIGRSKSAGRIQLTERRRRQIPKNRVGGAALKRGGRRERVCVFNIHQSVFWSLLPFDCLIIAGMIITCNYKSSRNF